MPSNEKRFPIEKRYGLTVAESKFVEEIGLSEVGVNWICEKLGQVRDEGEILFFDDKSTSAMLLNLERMDKPIVGSYEFDSLVCETAMRSIGYWDKFSEKRDELLRKELNLSRINSKTITGEARKTVENICQRAREEVLDTRDKRIDYQIEAVKVKKRLVKAVNKARELASGVVEELTIFENRMNKKNRKRVSFGRSRIIRQVRG